MKVKKVTESNVINMTLKKLLIVEKAIIQPMERNISEYLRSKKLVGRVKVKVL